MTTIWPDPAHPGVPKNPERDGAHRLRHSEGGLERDALWLCGGTWVDSDGEFSIQHAALFYIYLGPCLSLAEVDARIATARKDGMKDAAKWHEVRSMELSGKAGVARNFRQLLRQSDFHMESAAEIRALKGQGDD